jgi:hypothetical protein
MREPASKSSLTPHSLDDLERLVPIDALASALLGALMASLAVIVGHSGDLRGLVLAGTFVFGGLGLAHWTRRVHHGARHDR